MGHRDRTERDGREEMRAEHTVDAVHNAIRDHALRTDEELLCRLEAEPDRARQVVHLGQHGGSTDQGAHVGVVTAGVHDTRGDGGVVKPGSLLYRDAIHVGADEDHRARPCALKIGDDTGSADSSSDPEPEYLHPLADDGGRPFLGECELGVLVQIAPQPNEIGLQTGDRLA